MSFLHNNRLVKISIILVMAIAVTSICLYRYFQSNSEDNPFKDTSAEYVEFGTYYGEDIIWKILDVDTEAKKALIVTAKVIDVQPYNDEAGDIDWENSRIRAWLNSDFINMAFDDIERSRIILSTVVNSDNPVYGTNGGNDTEDYVFLLSLDEAEKYFADDEERSPYPTEYAKKQGVYVKEDTGYSWWILRSPGKNSSMVAHVQSYGKINYDGFYADCSVCVDGGMRPAMWVNIS